MEIAPIGNLKRPMSVAECPACGAPVAAETRFCSECGSPVPGAEGTETRLRKYWSAPDLGLLAGLALAIGGVVLLALQAWLWAFLALGVGAAIFIFRVEAGRRATGAAVGRLSAHRRVVRARSHGQLELFRLRRELAELQAERNRGYQDLGRATHEGDPARAQAATARVEEVAARIVALEAEIATLLQAMEQRVRQAHSGTTSPTRGEAPPEPARVPEPFPPPDEGTPPAPARVPEPYPEPVPEPAPDDPPPEPEQPPAPETTRRHAQRAPNT